MKTIDMHTHLLNPQVKFNRLYDKLTLRFFAKSLGVDPGSSYSLSSERSTLLI